MNCRRVEKLIPLYVEGDLESRLSDLLASHLEWCGRCNWLADEFRESQSWLRSSEMPSFDEPFYADLKRDVLKRVSSTSARPSLIAALLQHWNRRQVLALCTGVMIIFGVLVLYLYQTRQNSGREVQEAVKLAPNDDTNSSIPPDVPRVAKRAPGAASEIRHRARRHNRGVIMDSRALLSRHTIEPSLFDETARNASVGVAAIPDTSSDSREMLRIEIQTSDPNIRIIWFAPKESDSNQNKPATD
jgi:Putative zinc-finger